MVIDGLWGLLRAWGWPTEILGSGKAFIHGVILGLRDTFEGIRGHWLIWAESRGRVELNLILRGTRMN